MMPDQFVLPLPLDLTAVAVGSVQGAVYAARAAAERNIDWIGVAAIGIATGLGGGMIRDLLLVGRPVALQSNAYILTAVIAALTSMLFAWVVSRINWLVIAVDAAALGLYLVVGTAKAIGVGLPAMPALFVGVLACTGGTIIRDLLLREPVAMLQVGSFYIAAAIGGGVTYLIVQNLTDKVTAAITAVVVTFGLRMIAVIFDLRTPQVRELRLDRITGERAQP